jgi:PAS domain S-box-containing protein
MSERILLVEDEALIAMAETRMLEAHGYRVIAQHSGEAALETIRRDGSIDLVLMDVDLGSGEMDGTATAEEILKLRDIPVLFLSSHTEAEIVERTERVSSYGFVGKQSGEAVILASIRMAFRLYRAHRELSQREELLEETGRLASIGGWEFDVESLRQRWSRNTYRIHGVPEDFQPDVEAGLNFFPPEARPLIEEAVKQAMEEGRSYDLELPFITAQGERRWIHTIGSPRYEEGKLRRVGGTIQDITARKEMELAVQQSEEQLQRIIESVQAGIIVHSLDEGIVHINRAAERILQLERKELLGRPVEDPIWHFLREDGSRVPPEEYPVAQVTARGEPLHEYVMGVEGPEGEEVIWVLIHAVPLYNANAEIDKVVVTAMDITRRRELERQLRQGGEEKEFLMKELNHRVKNNLLMISSLVNLKDSELGERADLSDIASQIDTIRLIHEKLYHRTDVSRIELGEYLQELLESLFSSFTEREVEVENRISGRSLSTRQVIPLGLIVNELATNAIKHGFTPESPARIVLELHTDAATGEYVLNFYNSGRAFPEEVDLQQPKSIGLRLITALAQQLHGSLELQRRPSPCFTLRFPMEEG